MPSYMLCLDRGWRSIATFAPPLHTSASASHQTNRSGTAFVAPECEPRCNQWALVPKREPSLLEEGASVDGRRGPPTQSVAPGSEPSPAAVAPAPGVRARMRPAGFCFAAAPHGRLRARMAARGREPACVHTLDSPPRLMAVWRIPYATCTTFLLRILVRPICS